MRCADLLGALVRADALPPSVLLPGSPPRAGFADGALQIQRSKASTSDRPRSRRSATPGRRPPPSKTPSGYNGPRSDWPAHGE
ncbi:hypothetical protein M885DRAFT_296008 [Pelagophyceae sp. CCMP2097]|nr:hypothetical protein M885DRAFT_296008 [Pelagophyceae sp. CCMP2097]